jgi:hypothetical protein
MLTPKTASQAWAVVFGTANTGPLNQIVDITNQSEAAQFGDSPLSRAVKVLLRYSASVMAVRYDPASVTAFSLLDNLGDRLPHAVILPGGQDFLAFANKCRDNSYLGIVDYTGTADELLALRQTSSGFGTKSMYLAITFPAVVSGESTEFLSCHLGGLICRAVKFDLPVSGEILRGATEVTFAVTDEKSDELIQAGVITVGPNFTLRGHANSLLLEEPTQDNALMRPVIEGIILRDVKRFLSSRIGLPVNLTVAREMASEISAYLAGRTDISAGFATFLEDRSTITDATAHLAYSLNIALPIGVAFTTEIAIEP